MLRVIGAMTMRLRSWPDPQGNGRKRGATETVVSTVSVMAVNDGSEDLRAHGQPALEPAERRGG